MPPRPLCCFCTLFQLIIPHFFIKCKQTMYFSQYFFYILCILHSFIMNYYELALYLNQVILLLIDLLKCTLLKGHKYMNALPKDPVMLLSFVNMQLRDNYSSLDEFCKSFMVDKNAINDKLGMINYIYDENSNQFK